MSDNSKTAYLSLGSNLGERKENIKKSLKILSQKPGITLDKYSSIYQTEPVGVSNQADFYNCVARIKTSLSPKSLLREVKSIELSLGRKPDTHLQPRPIDIDILLYGGLEISSRELTIPHPRFTDRVFTLIPLLEIDPDRVHPISFKPLKKYLDEISPPQKVERLIDAGKIYEPAKEN